MPCITLRLIALALASSALAADAREPESPRSVIGLLPFGAPTGAAKQFRTVGATPPTFEKIVTPILARPAFPRDWLWAARQIYKGSIHRVSPETPAADLPPRILNFVSGILADEDFIPFDRLEYFNWCVAPDKVIVGWFGQIDEIDVTPFGWFVVLRVSPRLE